MMRLALLQLAIPAAAAAQADTTRIMIAGTVLDPLRKPIEGVEVRIPGTANSVLSSPAGTFRPAKYAGTAKYDDFFRWQRQGFGDYINREEIDRKFAARTAEILQGRAGVKVSLHPVGMTDATMVMFARCNGVPPKINVYVDGRKLTPDVRQDGDVEQEVSQVPGRGSGSGDPGLIEKAMRARSVVGEMLSRVNPPTSR
jgi:hypothetical protein